MQYKPGLISRLLTAQYWHLKLQGVEQRPLASWSALLQPASPCSIQHGNPLAVNTVQLVRCCFVGKGLLEGIL